MILEPSGLNEGLLEAARLVEDREEERAFELLLELERDHPEDSAVLCLLGVVAGQLGAEGMGADYFRRCLAQEPSDPAILVTAGSGLASVADPAAEPALRLAALIAPELAVARLHYGIFLVRSGLLEQGLEELLTARRLEPDDAAIRRELSIGYFLSRREGEALYELETAVSLEPDDPDVRLLFGLLLLHVGDVQRAAEELYPAAAAAFADDGETQLLLALLFLVVGWEDEAWLALSRAETAADWIDAALILEVEEALEAGEEAARSMLVDELAASALRDRIYRQ